MQKRSLNTYAVSEVVSTVLVISIVLGTVATILTWGVPYMQEKQSESQMQKVHSNYDDIDNTVDDLILQGFGTKKSTILNSYNDKSSLEIKESSDKLIVYYSFNQSYDFNISGLEDDDGNFILNMVNVTTPIKADYAYIYPLSMEETSWFFNLPKQEYRQIYDEYIYAQKFKPPERWNLSKIDLKISKYGNPKYDLYVSIYENVSNPLDLNNYLIQEAITADNISNSMQNIEYTFNNPVELFPDKEYFLVLNTTSGNKYTEYYKWGIENKYYCLNEVAYNGTKAVGSITLYNLSDDIRLNCRFIYNENAPPSKAKITFENLYYFSGVPGEFTLNASDTDEFRYIVVWGDNDMPFTSINKTASDPPERCIHTYIYPGIYTIKVITNDSYGNIAENITTVNVSSWNDAPEDMSKDILFPDWADVNENNQINYTKPFKGNFRIDLYNSTTAVFEEQYGYASRTIGYTPFGRIWIFDLNCLSYSSIYSSGNFKVIYENGAILIEDPDQVIFKKYPTFFEETNVVSLRVIDTVLNDLFSHSASGKGTYRLRFGNLGSISREPYVMRVYNLKMQIFGDNSNYLIDYYLDNYNFSKKLNNQDIIYDNTIFYNEQEKFLFFDTSLIEVSLEAIL